MNIHVQDRELIYTFREIAAGKLVLRSMNDHEREWLQLVVKDGMQYHMAHNGNGIVFRSDAGPAIEFRVQSREDRSTLVPLGPFDQEHDFIAKWTGPELVLTAVAKAETLPAALPTAPDEDPEAENFDPKAERAKLKAMDDANLQTAAAEAGVEWDTKASRDTMIKRILAAKVAPAAAE